jgi:hypothetical protein
VKELCELFPFQISGAHLMNAYSCFFAGVLPLEVKNNWQASLSGGSSVHSTCGHTIHQLRGMYRQDEGK